ncbi:hypothetical protein KBX06_08940 [Micromonospora sp. C31]|uniref:alpha-L-arabinofuranosidase C-terminal domain-containing protein n=1 Tax=Micromonospora sp. C31 TaxID=2824876 RepID=UPI001B37DCA7|nr:alpha-L-arabinofuranosidase C-terminal domain-containing protein [Micromonospora sp. C31]MBQ1073290.1 hypothetical protein [Micromonospora sp. C31]
MVDAVATHDAAMGGVAVFVVYRDRTVPIELTIDLSRFGPVVRTVEASTLSDDDVRATNTVDQQEWVVLRPNRQLSVHTSGVQVVLPPVSWTAVRLPWNRPTDSSPARLDFALAATPTEAKSNRLCAEGVDECPALSTSRARPAQETLSRWLGDAALRNSTLAQRMWINANSLTSIDVNANILRVTRW